MYLGEIVECAEAEALCAAPAHPYTEALLSAVPEIDDGLAVVPRQRIGLTGDVPSPLAKPPGCPFSSRCRYVQERCRSERPVLRELAGHRQVACHFHLQA